MQDLLSQVVLILRKGEHLGLTLRIIECYLLLGGLPVLNEYMPLILAALEHSVQAVLEAKESPQTPQQLKIRGKITPSGQCQVAGLVMPYRKIGDLRQELSVFASG